MLNLLRVRQGLFCYLVLFHRERVEQAKKNTAEFDEARRKGAAGLPQQEVIHVEPDRRGRTPDQVRDLHFKQRGNRG
jgi:hypothetical protein